MKTASISIDPATQVQSQGRGAFFSRFVARVGALPVTAVTRLRAEKSVANLEQLFVAEQRAQEAKDALLAKLHQKIGGEEDEEKRRQWINIRRKLNKRRSLPIQRLKNLPGDLTEAVEALLQWTQEVADLQLRFAAQLEQEQVELRKVFQREIRGENFQKGLLLSSRDLFNGQQRYLRTDPAELRQKEKQIERGLLRYFTRAAMKATPFATFCSVVPGSFEDLPGRLSGASELDESDLRLSFGGDPRPSESRARTNKQYFGFLVDLLGQEAEVRDHFKVFLNPTIRREPDGTLVFLLMNGVRETFQRLPSNPTIELIERVVSGEGSPFTVLQLIERLDNRPELTVSTDQIRAFVEKLMLIGFLRLTTGIPVQETAWNPALVELLQGIDHPSSQDAIALLQKLQRQTERFVDANSDERSRLLDQINRDYALFRDRAETEVSVQNPIYEDAGSDSAQAHIRRTIRCRRLENELECYVELTSRLSPLRAEMANMRHFFALKYGDLSPQIPLLTFYEDYYRQHYKEHLRREAQGDKQDQASADGYDLANPFGLDLVQSMLEAHGQLVQYLGRRYQEPIQDLFLDFSDLEEILAGVPPRVPSCDTSVMFFGELGARGSRGESRFIFRGGTYFPGFGKMFSRFLYLFPESFKQAVFDANSRPTAGVLAELAGDSNFNANLHPQLLPAEISYPIGEDSGHGDSISIADLLVHADPNDPHALALKHKDTGQRVFPVDLGFLSLRLRPPLYRLLAAFMPAPTFGLPAPGAPKPKTRPQVVDKQSVIERRPRVYLGQSLILQRRTWLLPGSLFPFRGKAVGDAEYFERIERWRRKHRIPSEVYVRIHQIARRPAADPESIESSDDEKETNGKEQTRARRQGLMKPQYIDFQNPLLLGLFAHLPPAGTEFTLIMEERLPDDFSLAAHGDEPFATEVILQLNVPL